MFTKRINASTALPAQFEGTPGVYARRESPPQIPPTTERPVQQPINKDSRSLSNSHVSLIRNRVDSSTQSIANFTNAAAAVSFEKTPDGIRRLSHTPQQTQRRAVARYELSSHSFNVPHSSSYLNNNSAAQRRGKPASLENARNSQDNNQDAHFTKGRLGPSVSFGNFVEPLILPPIALQNVYAASARNAANAAAIQEHWQQRNNNNFDPNFTVAGDSTKLDLDRLPPGWEIGLTNDEVRYYIDHNNGRTHWIHPLAPENLTPGWTKIFDKIHGVVYYNHLERRSQFEHPGLAASTISGPMLPTIHGSSSLQSMEDIQLGNGTGIGQIEKKNGKNFDDEEDDNDLNIINNEDVPEWLKLYSQAPFSADHLLNFNLFKTTHLEHFDNLIMKLYKAEIMSIVRKYDAAMCEIDSELSRRHAAL